MEVYTKQKMDNHSNLNERRISLPVFIFIIFLIAATLWILLSFVFIPLGRIVSLIWKNAKDAMNKEDSL